MAIQARASIVINRPMQEVWSYLDDVANDPVWRRPYVIRVTRATPGETAVGTRFEGVLRNGPYVSEIAHCEPPVRMSWRYLSYPAGPIRGKEGSYLLAPKGRGTRVTLMETYVMVGLLGAVMRLPASILARRVLATLLKQLRAGVTSKTSAQMPG